MNVREIRYKFKAKLYRLTILKQRNMPWYRYLYPSFWHKIFTFRNNIIQFEPEFYVTARPNPGAGIGHQISNWVSGYTFAKKLNIKFANIPFSDISNPFLANDWEEFLGFSSGEKSVSTLKKNGYEIVRLPLFDDTKESDVLFIKKIIGSYEGKKIFILEQDQKIHDELLAQDFLCKKYWNNKKRKKNDMIKIIVHIRRGDIVCSNGHANGNLKMRWLDNSYYVSVIKNVLTAIKGKKYEIHLFSQGCINDFVDFEVFDNLFFHLDESAIEAFYHMTKADILVMSRSGFSFQASKLNMDGLIIYPYGFWHEPTHAERTVIPSATGRIDERIISGFYGNKC